MAGLPQQPVSPMRPDASPELVTVMETLDAFVLGLAKASLEDAGIEFEIDGGDQGSRRLFGIAITTHGTELYRVQVAHEDEVVARELMEPLQNPDPALPEIDGGESVE